MVTPDTGAQGIYDTRRRLLLMTDSVNTGGAELYLHSLIRSAVEQLDVTLALPRRTETQDFVDAVRGTGARVEYLEVVRGRGINLRGTARALHLIRHLRPDVIHFNLGSPRRAAEAIVAARLARVPRRVATIHLAPERAAVSLPVDLLMRVNRALRFRQLSTVITVSESNKRLLAREHQVPEGKIVVIPNGVDTSRFAPRPSDGRLRAGWAVPASAPLLGIIARLNYQKGHAVLIAAMADVWGTYPEARLVIVGTGELEPPLRAQVREMGGDERIVFAGHTNRPEQVLGEIDVLVLPSFFEGMPLTALEASSTGVPVIASAVGGTTEVVRDGETGVLVPPGDRTALATAIVRLIAAPDVRARMGAAGRALILRDHQESRMIERTLRQYT